MSSVSTPENYLLVPINVEALVVGRQGGQWTDLHPDFSLLFRGQILGSQITPEPFNTTSELHKAGIHLHWALPGALTHGRQTRPANPQEPLPAPEFPRIPNRWMVQRISRQPQTNDIAVRAWVVESDYLYATDGNTPEDAVTFPQPDAYALFDYVGKTFDYTAWTEQRLTYNLPLTALGYGDPAFAAYYPACKSLLGLYDPLTDVADNITLAYLVVGWYSDPAQDILHRCTMQELQWACASDTDPPLTRLLCHGTIYNIQWQGHDFPYASAVPSVDARNYRIALGNTTTEALAALLAQQLEQPRIEPLLAAFQEDRLAQHTDLLELDASLHQHRFGSLAGGRQFAIQKKDAREDQPLSATDVTLPESVEQLLAELQALEQDYDRRQRQWDGSRWELYAMWYEWVRQYRASGQEPAAITEKINTLKQVVTEQAEQLNTAKSQRDTAEQALKTMVQQQFADLELVTSLAAPFWHANDPVLLLAGPGLVPSQRHGHADRSAEQEAFPCRVTGQELHSLIVDIPNGQAGIHVRATEVFRLAGNPFAGGGAVPAGITDALLFEALLLDPGNAEAIAERAYIAAGLPTRPNKEALVRQIQQLQRPPASTREDAEPSGRYDGVFPAPVAWRDWEGNPWLPLFLAWRIAWYPSYTDLARPLEHWELAAEEGDFRWTGAPPALTSSNMIYRGYTILTPHAVQHFQERLRQYNQDKPDRDLEQIITQLDHLPVLGQALGGFHDALIMRDQCLQIPPINPAIFVRPEEDQRDPIIEFVKGVNFVSPDPTKAFLPIRAGHMKVLAVSVVDAFGQTLQLPGDSIGQPIRAASLDTAGQGNEPFLQFAPRFAQPLRLRFAWSPTPNPPGTYPVNSPVCGWVIPNHLDNNLTFYDGHGTPLGALQKILRVSAAGGTGGTPQTDARAFFWVPMPGTTQQPEAILNPHLQAFVRWLRDMDADTGTALWNLLDAALARTDPGEPEDDPLLALLLGRPLALVRAELALELAGLAASDQRLDRIGTFDTRGFTRVKCPVRLGEAQKDTDGLIGYFTDDTSGAFYPAAGASGTSYPGAIEYGHALALDCETPLPLTLLMDPRARVHAITGLLPRASIVLPPRLSSAAKSAREAFFQVAPLLSPGGAISMPKPSDDYGKWSWAYRPQVTMWQEVETIGTAADRAGFAPQPQHLSEGWLKLHMHPVTILNFWVKEGMLAVPAQTNITLGWTLQGGDQVSLLASENGQEPRQIEMWTTAPLPEQCRVQVSAQTTYLLVLQDKDGNRSEKRLTVTLKEENGHG